MKISKIIVMISIGIILTSIVFLSGLILSFYKVSGSDINNGKKIGNSIFTLYNDKIYATVPSNGEYVIVSADPSSFRTLSKKFNYRERQFAIDKNNSYCGNRIIPDLDPNKVDALGHSYFSDGKHTLYCAPFTLQNVELSNLKELYQTWLYGWSFGEKPQTFYYPIRMLPLSKIPYQPILDADLISNGEQVFYEGNLMPDASVEQLKAINILYNDGSLRKSHLYHHDKLNVYYKQYKLGINNSPDLYSFYIGNLYQNAYLFEPNTGQISMNNIDFPLDNAPYKVISHHGGHVYHGLFLSNQGVYFYDTQQKKIRRAGDNPFLKGHWKEIAPLVFSYNSKTYFLQTSENWGGNKSPGLISRSTHLYLLDENTVGEWKKLGDVTYHRYGEVWQKGNSYYYFDKLGTTQGIYQTIYRIVNMSTLEHLLNDELRVDEMRKIIGDKEQLQPAGGIKILTAKTQYRKTLTHLFDDE